MGRPRRIVAAFFGAAIAVWVTAVAPDTARAQTPPAGGQARPGQRPARDRQTPAAIGTAVLRGRVVAADTGAPVRRVLVQANGGGIRNGRSTTTDNDGRFELRELPAGRYTVRASKAGYVTLQFGQRRPFEPGRPLEIVDGQVVEKLDFALPRGAVITGRVTDEFGEPVAEARVQAMRYRFTAGRRRLVPVGADAQTNDIGEYRIYGLSPGEYLVHAAARVQGGGDSTNTASDVLGYAPTFFPGTPVASEAQRVPLGLGAQMSADIALMPAKLARITGSVIDATGRPFTEGFVSVRPASRDGGPLMGPRGSRLRDDGTFLLGNLAPGEYVVSFGIDPRRDNDPGEWGSRLVSVIGSDVSGVVIATTKGTSLAGRVVGENGAVPGIRPQGLRVFAAAADPETDQGGAGRPGSVQDNWTFELHGLAGPRIFRISGTPDGWILKSVLVDGRDVTDEPIDVSQVTRGIEIVLTSQTTELSGAVTDQRGQLVKDYVAVVFSDDADHWIDPQSRRVRSARPDQDGRFSLRNLPPGSYLAIALEYTDDGEASDPEALDRWRTLATPAKLGDGETKTIELKLSPRP